MGKIVLVVLILFAVLFAVGVGLAHRGNDDPAASNMNWVDKLSASFSPVVEFKTLQGDCLDPAQTSFRIPGRSECKISIPPSDESIRQMKMTLARGVSVTGRYHAPASQERLGDQKVTFDMGDRRSMTLAVVGEAGVLSLTCNPEGKAPCVVEVK